MNLYLHVPFCERKCHYCAFYSVAGKVGLRNEYPAYLLREWDLLDLKAAAIDTLYIGGGTPGLLGRDGFRTLAEGLRVRGLLDQLQEWTVELNPASTTVELLLTLRDIGVNRISLGAQCFDDEVLHRIGRRHDAAAIVTAVKAVKQAGFSNYGIDLIAGLPGMTPTLWRESLQQALALACTHLSVYGLMVEPDTPLSRSIQAGMIIPDVDVQMDALAETDRVLTAAGFEHYEISNYARSGMMCRHNLAVWRGEDYVGLGPAAASRHHRQRWNNLADVMAYQQALSSAVLPPRENEELLSEEDDALERVLYRIRLQEGFSPASAGDSWPILASRVPAWEAALGKMERQGITSSRPSPKARWCLTRRGREVADTVIRDLL